MENTKAYFLRGGMTLIQRAHIPRQGDEERAKATHYGEDIQTCFMQSEKQIDDRLQASLKCPGVEFETTTI